MVVSSCRDSKNVEKEKQLDQIVLSRSKVILEKDGIRFRDLNKNGMLDIYEDINQPVDLQLK